MQVENEAYIYRSEIEFLFGSGLPRMIREQYVKEGPIQDQPGNVSLRAHFGAA